MLRLTVHAGKLATASRFNLTNWLDLAYERLEPVADYKLVLFTAGIGATPPVVLMNYPRWSTSLWDLIARALALTLSPDLRRPTERVPSLEPGGKRSAFASALCALVEHYPAGDDSRRTTLATAEIVQVGRTRCMYRASFEEDTMPVHRTEPFQFAPKILRPAELVLHAALMRLTGQREEFPLRPPLARPAPVIHEGRQYVPIHKLSEPARTGFLRWLLSNSEPPITLAGNPDGISPETMYLKFLLQAI